LNFLFLAVDTTVSTCLTQTQIGGGVSMKLTWGQLPSDLDSWLFTPDGDQIYFGNQGSLVSRPFASLDVDDTSSFGPEVVTLTRSMVGTYKYAVNNYSGQGSGAIGASGARVELSLPGRTVELFTPPTVGESTSTDWWQLFELDVAANCSITVRRTGWFSISPPASGKAPRQTTARRPERAPSWHAAPRAAARGRAIFQARWRPVGISSRAGRTVGR